MARATGLCRMVRAVRGWMQGWGGGGGGVVVVAVLVVLVVVMVVREAGGGGDGLVVMGWWPVRVNSLSSCKLMKER